jgi:Flp pilus assembly protein TadG
MFLGSLKVRKMSYEGIQRKDELRKATPPKGQGLIEFALLLPILVLIIFGVLELGRAFFAFIAITNAAREGARVYTFRPDVTTIGDVYEAVTFEIGTSPLVDVGKIASIQIQCGSTYGIAYTVVFNDTTKIACPKEQPIRTTVTYNHDLIFRLFFPATLTLRRSAEMMVP